MFLRKAPKDANSTPKCESKILVNGSIVARVHHKTKPEVERPASATAPEYAPQAEIPMINQYDSAL
jgi:hypothetical protein